MKLFGHSKPKTPLGDHSLVLADLDGVVYRGQQAIDSGIAALNKAAETVNVGYVTNNASKTVENVAAILREFGLNASKDNVITSPQAAIRLLRETVPEGSKILMIGGDGIESELMASGYQVVHKANEKPDAVVQGFAPHLGWSDLAEAAFALQEGPQGETIPWIATNTDWTLPLEQGLAPGNGTLVSAVHTAVARLPEFAGKPEKPIFEAALTRFGTRNALMIGDRLDTDIQGANAVGISSLLVLTGVDRPKQLLAAAQNMRPDFIVASLEEMFEDYPITKIIDDSTVQVGKARVRMRGHIVEIVKTGDDALNLLRAATQAIWRSGLAIYGLKVPDELLIDHWR